MWVKVLTIQLSEEDVWWQREETMPKGNAVDGIQDEVALDGTKGTGGNAGEFENGALEAGVEGQGEAEAGSDLMERNVKDWGKTALTKH